MLVLGAVGTGFADTADMTLGMFKRIGGDWYQGAVIGATWALRSSEVIRCDSLVSGGMVQATRGTPCRAHHRLFHPSDVYSRALAVIRLMLCSIRARLMVSSIQFSPEVA